MKVVVDRDLCEGHGLCMGEAPDVFQVDLDGNVTILLEHPPEEHRAAVADALRYCPTGAISLED